MTRFTKREQEVIALMVEGLNREEIAGRVGIEKRSIDFHINNIYGKLGVHNRLTFLRHPDIATKHADDNDTPVPNRFLDALGSLQDNEVRLMLHLYRHGPILYTDSPVQRRAGVEYLHAHGWLTMTGEGATLTLTPVRGNIEKG